MSTKSWAERKAWAEKSRSRYNQSYVKSPRPSPAGPTRQGFGETQGDRVRAAYNRSAKANDLSHAAKTTADHKAAMEAHIKAANAQEHAGNHEVASEHRAMADKHADEILRDEQGRFASK
jgi:hypothetical protein